ncbi:MULTISPECIES: TetR/AcrR family transcriptional regulator [unclassified Streptomyces]|uniref:TetR/AcrR family transcriptional regulator n=1 Tax=unclassified Streptomyces TaxID=2593676 RepID=UPI002DD816F5|nr:MULTISPECIES: TetR/AcrR family transcriptional regulator [unclassified Streptomyces]WSA93006.1 TetR/AcrR family transcriptional regulator [Streptomyces sp. NBC_01795]WSB77376.1 TetR/AcrR family transcriptional regulator [Streptomyces sp. NBC_01775]WSS14359.1 TetR/AcrR family transcriptional regulator [Streptomyces sp. NBC_01186]WSS43177.1 TetR/AcrR family transcriptional regulator [Streptomyces sp. NBC_01187]
MPTPKSTRPTRERIIDAAEHLLRTIGLARTTTKEIAREAGCSEAALYKHFRGKEEIFVQVLQERLPRLNPLLRELSEDPGERGVERNLIEIAEHAALFYEQSFPIAASLYAEPTLQRRHFEGVRTLGQGPRTPLAALADYLRRERERGAVRADADVDAAAALLLGACAQRAFLYDFAGGERPEQPLAEFAASLVRTLMHALVPTEAGGAGRH